MALAVDLCFRLTKYLVARRDNSITIKKKAGQGIDESHEAGVNPHTFDLDSYSVWRDKSLEAQFYDHFSCAQLTGKRILDFGCGTGYLCNLAVTCGAATVDGIELDEKDVEVAQRRFKDFPGSVSPKIHLTKNDVAVEFDDDSFDIIFCFDVIEHIMHYKEIIREWKRILSPGGRILIWWQPYYHPWGHHLESVIPIPWAHVIFSNETLAEVVYRIKKTPEYKPRYWDLNKEGKRIDPKKPDPKTLGGLNGLSTREFERICLESGLLIARRDIYPFNGPKAVKLISGMLTHVPFLDEFFSAYLIYELENSVL